ncbi:MAG: hypothetical protein IKU09_06520 [Firmicutes bacterium]|nr:hypothetical protein [Bacillota bacterium]
MKKNIDIIVANPSGNITIFVKTPVPRSEYQTVASQLLAMKELGGEQVAFILQNPQIEGIDGSMEMCGLEFCGNASRSFALVLAQEAGDCGTSAKTVLVSGCDEPLTVELDMDMNTAKIRMPNPVSCEKKQECTIVDFGGILHIIVEDLPPSKEVFDLLKDRVYEQLNPPAMGVMFWNTEEKKLTPVVYVKEVDTTYFEGSCGSGTTAMAAAFSLGREDGTYSWSIPQPEGTIDATAVVKDGRAAEIYIDSPVDVKPLQTVEVEI